MLVRFELRYFVPRDLGLNDDARELVVLGPSQIELHRRGNVGMDSALDEPCHYEGERRPVGAGPTHGEGLS